MKAKAAPPNWDQIQGQVDELLARRSDDQFLRKVMTGAIRIAMDADNPIRGNLFASACREAVTHILHILAPEDVVRSCHWFEQAKDTERVTRAQRAEFIAHGGLLPSYVEGVLGISRDEYVKPLTKAIEELNKRTHVKPETVFDDDEEIRWSAISTLHAIGGLLDAAEECRSTVASELRHVIDRTVMDRLIGETISELDELSTHTLVEGAEVDDVTVEAIGAHELSLAAEGTVYVTLQYGSGSDFSRGDGASMNDDYPFTATLSAYVDDPSKVVDVVDLKVDNSSFYE